MLVGNVDSGDSNVGKIFCICVTTGYITPPASEEAGQWWKESGKGLQGGRWKFLHTHESVGK